MKNEERIEGLRALKSQLEANVATEARLNQEMGDYLADPNENAPQRAEEFGDRAHVLYQERKLILARLARLDPVFSAGDN
jgi:hypothetical protein